MFVVESAKLITGADLDKLRERMRVYREMSRKPETASYFSGKADGIAEALRELIGP